MPRAGRRLPRARSTGTSGGADARRLVAGPDPLPLRHVVAAPVRPVDRPTVEHVLEVIQVDVPAGEHLELVLLGQPGVGRAGEARGLAGRLAHPTARAPGGR